MELPQGVSLRFWQTLSAGQYDEIRSLLYSVIHENAERLVSTFYGAFLQHREASAFLTNSIVHDRLSHSLRDWLLDLLDVDFSDPQNFEERQAHIGEVHARIGIPVSLVLEGASLLKTELAHCMIKVELSAEEKMTALICIDELIDYSMQVMSGAYVSGTNKRAHVDEAFRLFSLGQDIATERESQRAALMEWCQKILFGLVTNQAPVTHEPLTNSQFGLWVRHRATILFQGATMLTSIEKIVAQIDQNILPAILKAPDAAAASGLIGQLQAKIDEIKFLISDLFQAASDFENGRDPLTRALNRKFLAPVLSREVTLASTGRHPLSVMMIDIDRFKAINDQFGHPAGDAVLRHAADIILDTVRISDFVFRYGGEEFLIVLVETDKKHALQIAERLRARLAEQRINLPDQQSAAITISVGVAEHEGHPDYQYLINAADRALYEAKNSGRNRVVST